MNDLSVGRKYGAVTGTIPRQISVVPGHYASRMRARCGDSAGSTVFGFPHSKRGFAAFDNAAVTARNVINAAYKRMCVIALVVLFRTLRAIPPDS